jgi:hypothetical protein
MSRLNSTTFGNGGSAADVKPIANRTLTRESAERFMVVGTSGLAVGGG